MSFNGSGTFQINTAGQPVVSGTVISSTAFNALTADLATGLSTCITKDGQTTVTANIPMGNNKITGLAVGTAATDAANLSQVQSTAAKLINSVSGADTITGTMSPTLASYAAGQMFYWVAAGDNTGAVTLNIDSLGAKSVTRDGSVALAAGDIKSGEVVVVVYDGTRFQVVSQVNSGGDATFANVSITSALNVGGVATFSAGTVSAPSITANGDTNTGIFFPAADTIAFAEGGVEALRIDSSANVGIGTSSPAQRLDVTGASNSIQARFGNVAGRGLTIGTTIISGTNDAGVIFNAPTTTDGSFIFQCASVERMRLDNAGNLGIGTTSPGARLQVKSSAAQAVNIEGTTARGSGNIFAAFLDPTGRKGYFGYGSASDDGFYLYNEMNAPMVFATNNTERMRLDSSGNLGIGTASPGQKLEVAGNQRFTGSQVGTKIENQQTGVSVSTATTILDDAGGRGRLVIVNGISSGDRFCDLVLCSTGVSPTVVSSYTSLGSPAARTYTRSGSALQLAMASGTYTVTALALGY